MSTTLNSVDLSTSTIERFEPLLDRSRWLELTSTMRDLADRMRGRTLWNINSTARGGGVAEMLAALVPYDRGCGVDERWSVIEGSPAFFNVTKRIHNLLHGSDAGGIEISADERSAYEKTLRENASVLIQQLRAGDVAILHDPQTAGLVPALADHGVEVIWRCHVGVDEPNDAARSAWRMLIPYLARARAYVFSRQRYAWEGLDPKRVHVIAPTIDPFSVKNRDLPDGECAEILRAAGIVRAGGGPAPNLRFARQASLTGDPVSPDAAIVTQVSRWDRLKDPVGVLDAFVRGVAPETAGAVLVLAGPGVSSVDDDPEQPQVLEELAARRGSLPADVQSRILIAQLPMDDLEENATMVNALQRRANVVVQKSIAEGFGLTVAEAMWKARPIVASRVGGIEDQIEDGSSGLLIDDPRDLVSFARAITDLLHDPAKAQALGEGARRRAIAVFLAPRYLVEQARLIMSVVAPG